MTDPMNWHLAVHVKERFSMRAAAAVIRPAYHCHEDECQETDTRAWWFGDCITSHSGFSHSVIRDVQHPQAGMGDRC